MLARGIIACQGMGVVNGLAIPKVYDGNLAEVVYCSMRRCLCYPLYRHWRLARAVLEDTKMIFQLGK